MSLICRAIFIVCFCLLRFSGIASAQSETAAPTFSSSILPTTTARNGAAQTHIITVGKGNNRFVPDITQASVGDIIQFQFFPPNHSVIRAEYGYPCIPYEDTGVDKVGFFSGFKPVDVILSTPPTFELTINDTNPIFYYCAAPGSCINFAMVGVINPNSSVSLATQQALAHKADYMLVPGEHFPAEASSSLASLAAASTSTSPTSSAAATSTSAAPAANATTSHKLSTGAIVGIAIGGAAVLLLAAALFFFIG
ncbi:Pho80p cyclin, partial [Cryomyces antarcticus]